MKPISYARHRFPPDIIRQAVWLYLRFTLRGSRAPGSVPTRPSCGGTAAAETASTSRLNRRLSSTTNSDPMERRFAKLASRDCASKDCAPIIEPRTRISRFDDGSGRRKALNGQISSAFGFRPCGRLQCVQCSTTPDLPTDASAVSSRGSQRLERRDELCGLESRTR